MKKVKKKTPLATFLKGKVDLSDWGFSEVKTMFEKVQKIVAEFSYETAFEKAVTARTEEVIRTLLCGDGHSDTSYIDAELTVHQKRLVIDFQFEFNYAGDGPKVRFDVERLILKSLFGLPEPEDEKEAAEWGSHGICDEYREKFAKELLDRSQTLIDLAAKVRRLAEAGAKAAADHG